MSGARVGTLQPPPCALRNPSAPPALCLPFRARGLPTSADVHALVGREHRPPFPLALRSTFATARPRSRESGASRLPAAGAFFVGWRDVTLRRGASALCSRRPRAE